MVAETLEVGALCKIIAMVVCLTIMHQSMNDCTDARHPARQSGFSPC